MSRDLCAEEYPDLPLWLAHARHIFHWLWLELIKAISVKIKIRLEL
jgi:hypothetical protein